ncbi:hypothetical protein PInf_005602 [Phytophthora infestans]|nr:hypothetical protein PInf_005602 [Phytophthora infestans]
MRARQDTGTDQQDKTQTPVEGGKQSGKQLEELTAGDEQERRLRSEEADAEGESYEYGDEDDAMADSDECEPTSTNWNVNYADNSAPMEDIISERESENTDPEKEGKTPTRHEPPLQQRDREEKIGYESEEVGPPKNKNPIQQYMHSYVTTHAHEPEEALRKRSQQGTQEDTTKLEKDGLLLTGTKRGDDMGRPLQDWLGIAGGQLTDVAANGHSNVVDEYKVLAAETEAALVAAGKFVSNQDSDKDKLCALANHYADQRNRSVKASVPMNYWVRPEHIKAMAMHARETVFVLDVLQEKIAHIQAYGYQDVVLSDKTAIETGVVFTLPSHTGADILRELTAVGTLPIIMVLHYSNMGNHYQAVTYEPMRYQAYTEQWRALTDRRNSILIKYGGRALDAEPYDADKLAKAATKELKALRRAAKEAKLTRPMREPPHVEKEFDSENKIDDERKLTDCDKYAPKQREQDLEERRPGSQLAEGIAETKQEDNRQGPTAPEPKPPTAH